MDRTIEQADVTGAEPGAPGDADAVLVQARPVRVERQGDDLTLLLFGALSMNVSEEVGQQGIDAIGDGAAMVTVDLAGVNFIDSTGIRALIRIHRRVEETGGRMMITRPHKAARHMLTLVHLDTVIPIGPEYDPQTDRVVVPPPGEDPPGLW